MSCTNNNEMSVSIAPAALVRCNIRYFIFQDENIIGRNENAFICIRDPVISRKHCVIKKDGDNKFTICDMSFAGTYINEEKLIKNKVQELNHLDKICLSNKSEYTYVFMINKKLNMSTEESKNLSSRFKEKILTLDNSHSDEMMKLNEQICQMETEKSGLKEEMNSRLQAQENMFKHEQLSLSKLVTSTNEQKEEAERNLREMEYNSKVERERLMQDVEDKIAAITKKEEELQQVKDEMEQRYQMERQELEERCRTEIERLKSKLAEYEMEQGRLEGVTREAEHKLKETKETLLKCEIEQFRLVEEKFQVETKLGSQIMDLTKESTSKDEVLQELEMKLKEKEEAEKRLKKGIEVLEEELQCSICAELFIEPSVLNCGHMFCKTCIDEWKQKKKVCPMCRAKIVSCVRLFTVDTIIEKNVALLSSEARSHREAVINERRGANFKVPAKKRKITFRAYATPNQMPMVVVQNLARDFPGVVRQHRRAFNIEQTVPPYQDPPYPTGPNMEVATPGSVQADPFVWAESPVTRPRTMAAEQDPFPPRLDSPVTVAAIDLTNVSIPTIEPYYTRTRNATATSANTTIDLTTP